MRVTSIGIYKLIPDLVTLINPFSSLQESEQNEDWYVSRFECKLNEHLLFFATVSFVFLPGSVDIYKELIVCVSNHSVVRNSSAVVVFAVWCVFYVFCIV